MPRGWRNHLLFYEQKKNRRHLRTEVRELSSALDLPDEEFLQNYKVSREMVDYLCDELEVDLAPGNADGLPVLIKVLTSLKILINGHYQRGVGQDQNLSIGQTTVSKYLQQFVDAVNRRLKPKWVVFPGTETSRQHVSEGFRRKFGLSDILGAVDCTHVDIFPPKKPHNVQYINRHGNTSINVQLVADADCRLLNVNAEYPGRVHDQFIFTHSVVKTEMRRLYDQRIGEYYLLGDSGYSLEPWLMTPIRDAPDGSPEYRYTQWHCQTRNLIERTNGYLKGTFRILGCDRSLHYAPEKASQLVYASCTLYNIMKYFRIPFTHMDEGVEEVEVRRDVNARLLGVAMQRRQQIVQNYFL